MVLDQTDRKTVCKGKDILVKKVLLKLSSSLESRKFEKTVKIVAVAPHLLLISTLLLVARLLILSDGCGLLSYPQSRQCESQRDGVRQ